MAWRGWELGMAGEQVRLIQDRLIRKFQWVRDKYPNLQANGYFDVNTQGAVRDFQLRVGLFASGVADYAMQKRLGLFDTAKATVFTIPGTWAGWNDGPPAWVAWGLDRNRYVQQGVGYSAAGFLTQNPQISYEESRDEGVEETVRLIQMTAAGTPIILIGYSQGADVAVTATSEFLSGGRLESRRNDLKRIITFGSPCRAPGPTLVGNNPPGDGISGTFTPDEFRSITFDYVNNGDMYASSTTLLKFFYTLLTKLELSVDFAMAAIQILGTSVMGGQTGPLGGILSGLFGAAGGGNSIGQVFGAVAPKASSKQVASMASMLTDLPDVVQTIQVALQFQSTQAHTNYHTWPDFGGVSAVRHAVDGLNSVRW